MFKAPAAYVGLFFFASLLPRQYYEPMRAQAREPCFYVVWHLGRLPIVWSRGSIDYGVHPTWKAEDRFIALSNRLLRGT